MEDTPFTEAEKMYTLQETVEGAQGGIREWTIFNGLRNSSTRTEIAVGLVPMRPAVAVNIGIDNKTTVDVGNLII